MAVCLSDLTHSPGGLAVRRGGAGGTSARKPKPGKQGGVHNARPRGLAAWRPAPPRPNRRSYARDHMPLFIFYVL